MFPDSTITDDLPPSKRELIMEVIQSLLDFFSDFVSVVPAQSPILLDRTCTGGFFLPEEGSTVRQCVNTCVTSVCGTVTIPSDHLKRCIECNGQQPPCSPGDPSTDGAGVSNTDYILYISANQNECLGQATSTVIAFAGACQLESSLDRPIAGFINFCPDNLEGTTRDFLFDVAKHELFHAIAFSSSLFPFWRDSNGEPRTQRDDDGLPPIDPKTNMHITGPSTVTTVNYTDWRTITGPRTHPVTVLITEAVLREGRDHFACGGLVGVELENQGGEGTALQHWEKRMLGNEAMTGVFDFNPVFSRLTLAVLEDSGWYTVNYSAAEPLLWGRGRGCGFVDQGCGDILSSDPFCDNEVAGEMFGCTQDRGSIARCNLVTLPDDVIADYRYLSGNSGGSLEIADYCPYYRQFQYASGRTGNCTNPLNQPDPSTNSDFVGEDVFGETYGPSSTCLRQGRTWAKRFRDGRSLRTLSLETYGAGCYEVECSRSDGVTVYVRGVPFQCECEGQELVVDVVDCDFTFTGSIICPSCSSLCGDACPSPEPSPCPTDVVEFPQMQTCSSSTTGPTSTTDSPAGSSTASLRQTATIATLPPLLAVVAIAILY
jgi:leishmanolysin-like peptidase